MDHEIQRELGYVLLIELLAYQLASPVKWIDTQDTIFDELKSRRLIEIGPDSTLTNMAKRTLAIRAASKGANPLESISPPQLLAFAEKADQVRYNEQPAEAPQNEPEEAAKETASHTEKGQNFEARNPNAGPTDPAPATVNATVAAPVQATTAREIKDDVMTAKDIVLPLISHKIGKGWKTITTETTIKQLAGGRSTLENEIVGDLQDEFGSIPDKPEDLTLEELWSTLNHSFQGKLGKPSLALVSRFISSKMPASSSITSTRQLLKSKWGLGRKRQDAVLMLAVAEQPQSRLANDNDAAAFLGTVVRSYATSVGLDLNSQQPGESVAAVGTVAFDPAMLENISGNQTARDREMLELYAKRLGIDVYEPENLGRETRAVIADLQAQLDVWITEHGNAYGEGIRPVFEARKGRKYDSSWNWAAEDTIRFLYDVSHNKYRNRPVDAITESYRIARRATPNLLEIIQYTLKKAKLSSEEAINMTENLLVAVKKAVEGTDGPDFLSPQHLHPNGSLSGKKDNLGKAKFVKLKRKTHHGWTEAPDLTHAYSLSVLEQKTTWHPFHGRNFLLTGCGSGSIGASVLEGLLAGGASVIATTSHHSYDTMKYFERLYREHGSGGSQLVVVPCNQGSQQDIQALAQYIYDTNGLNWDIDVIIPFAAISETGREIDRLDAKSELAHRLMLTNLLRLLGAIKNQKLLKGSSTRPAQVILPLSPNHGIFGADGLYAESKLGLETLLEKWHSESWDPFLSICGAVIGWTRGTGLMHGNDVVADRVEKELGVATYSTEEIANCLLGLMSSRIAAICDDGPLWADLSGGLDSVENLKKAVATFREEALREARIKRALEEEEALQTKSRPVHPASAPVKRRAMIHLDFPPLPENNDDQSQLSQVLQDGVDLEKVVVVTGFSEVSPYGNSRTRWEMETRGHFSLSGCVEMAWIMGLIKNHNGPLENHGHYNGWIDVQSKAPIDEQAIKEKYEKHILEHTGIRIAEPSELGGFDPHRKQLLQEVVITEDLPPFETSREAAEDFKREHGDNVNLIEPKDGSKSAEVHVQFKKGARVMVPKALEASRHVLGQLPTGWDPKTYGISDEIISQVDPVTLYSLVATVEALLASGIINPYELYRHVHTSEVAICLGAGAGPVQSINMVYHERTKNVKEVSKDILQETFPNTTGAWVNMLILSSNGPIHTPLGACAASIESLDIGYNEIVNGKAKVALVGGFDGFAEQFSFEFGNMKATLDTRADEADGRHPKEMSRPATSTRRGFVEAYGSGVQVLTNAALALEMGLPIWGIVAMTGIASDGIGRSVPAPGKGLLTMAREVQPKYPSPLLNINYRRRLLDTRRKQIKESMELEIAAIKAEMDSLVGTKKDGYLARESLNQRIDFVTSDAKRQEKDALGRYGNQFWVSDPSISPIRGALAVWGLTVDDISAASMHGTSTVMNEKNELSVLHSQLSYLGRSRGNPLLPIYQKSITGHSKGAAGAWMVNGALQVLTSGLVPGHPNLDNVDSVLSQYGEVVHLSKSYQTDGVKAVSVTSFGFGQKGGQVVLVHPDYLFAAVTKDKYATYLSKLQRRQRSAQRHFSHTLIQNDLVQFKDKAPYEEEHAEAFMKAQRPALRSIFSSRFKDPR